LTITPIKLNEFFLFVNIFLHLQYLKRPGYEVKPKNETPTINPKGLHSLHCLTFLIHGLFDVASNFLTKIQTMRKEL